MWTNLYGRNLPGWDGNLIPKDPAQMLVFLWMETRVGDEWKRCGGRVKTEKKWGGKKKCVEALQGWNVNGGSLWHTVGTKELKLLKGYCHSNRRYLHQRSLSKVSWYELGHLVLARSKISHIPAGLGLPSSKSGGWAKSLSRNVVLEAPKWPKSGECLREGGGSRDVQQGTGMVVLMCVLNNVW